MEESKQKKKQYDKRYRREKMYSIAFRLRREADAELIEKYLRIPNKTDWFRKVLKDHTE